MRKSKALFLTLACGLTFAAAATAVACDKGSATPPAISSDWFEGEKDSVVTLRFEYSYLEMSQYESLALSYRLAGTVAEVEFSSSDESIATIDENGVVTTKDGVGSVIITATVEGVTASCEIKVIETQFVPEIILNSTEYTIENGETLEFSVATAWNKAEYTEDVEYAVSFAENSQASNATLSVDGSVITVVSNGLETIDIVVSTTVRGIYTSKVVTVNVVAAKAKIQALTKDFKPIEGKYEATISTTDKVGKMANSIEMAFAVTKNSQILENVEIDWSINSNAAKIENGKLIGDKSGSAIVTGTANVEGEEVTVQILCNVVPPEVQLEQTAIIEIENVSTLKIEEALVGTLQNAEINGQVVTSRVIPQTRLMTFKKEEGARRNPYFPMAASELGAQKMIINTDKVRYTMDVELYTMVINNAEELDKMATIAWTGEEEYWDSATASYRGWHSSEHYDGYFVLGNDIDYNKKIKSMTDTGKVWWCQGNSNDVSRGFRGIFDGQGYNIDGMTVGDNPSGATQGGGMFGYISKTGVVKNVSFTNAVALANNGFICSYGDGTIENVSISFKKLGGDKVTTSINDSTVRAMGAFFTQRAGANANVKNCLIDASAADITVEKGMNSGKQTISIKLAGLAEKVENVIVICPNQELLDASGADITRLTYNEVIAEGGLINNFDSSIWTTLEGIPMFINQAETIDRSAPIDFVTKENSLIVGFEMLLIPNNPYTKVEISEVPGVKYEKSILTATEEAYGKTVTVTATSLLNPEITATHEIYIDSFGKTIAAPAADEPVVYNTDDVLTIGDNTWKGDKNYVYLGAYPIGESLGMDDLHVDLDALQWGTQKVTIVIERNDVRESFSVNLKKWYVSADKKDAEKIKDSAMVGTHSNKEYELVEDTQHTEAAPEGYTNVMKLDCKQAWSTALSKDFWSADDISEYSDIWFAMKIVNGRWVMQAKQESEFGVNFISGTWVYFHFTQISKGNWVAEVRFGADKVFKTEFDIKETKLQGLMYRGGWSNGFLLYNNNNGEINSILPVTTSVYCTEVYAVKKA